MDTLVKVNALVMSFNNYLTTEKEKQQVSANLSVLDKDFKEKKAQIEQTEIELLKLQEETADQVGITMNKYMELYRAYCEVRQPDEAKQVSMFEAGRELKRGKYVIVYAVENESYIDVIVARNEEQYKDFFLMYFENFCDFKCYTFSK